MFYEEPGLSQVNGAHSQRIDALLGIQEEAEFFGNGCDRLLGMRYTPTQMEPTVGIVVSEPVLAQFIARYRAGTLQARALAAQGFAVQRYHYRGMGNSDGDVKDLTLESMVEDAGEAASLLRDATGVTEMVYLGASLGGYVSAAASRPDAPLIVDSPAPTGASFLRSAFRAHAVYGMQKEGTERLDTKGLLENLRRFDNVSLLGFRMPLGLYESLEGATLAAEVGGANRPVLLVASGRSGELNPVAEKVRESLVEIGIDVDTELRPKEDPFWYVENTAPEDQPDITDLATAIGRWINRVTRKASPTETREVGSV
jgi:pimeloyl-ACP methyl ester carboxylesterase